MSGGAHVPATPNQNPNPIGAIRSGIIGVVVILLVVMFNVTAKEESTKPSPVVVQQVVEVNPRPEQIRFQNGECHPALIKLAGNWFSYPVGGPVNFVDESGNIVHTSEPGSDKEFTMNDGWYRVCPKEKQTRGVDIIRRPW